MGHIPVIGALAAGVLALSLGATAAQACSCQKEYMLKKYGSVSALPATPAPATPPAGGSTTLPTTPAPAGSQAGG